LESLNALFVDTHHLLSLNWLSSVTSPVKWSAGQSYENGKYQPDPIQVGRNGSDIGELFESCFGPSTGASNSTTARKA
jgi:hypothetical protein